MKKNLLLGKTVLYTFLFSILFFAVSCANHTKKESTQQKLKMEPEAVKTSAALEEKQDTVMFQKKLRFFKNYDLNKDKKISEKEYLDLASKKFDTLDTNHDGKLSIQETDLVTSMVAQGKEYVTKKEFLSFYTKKFQTMDKNKDNYVTIEELDIREN